MTAQGTEPTLNDQGGMQFSMGVLGWIATPTMYKGRVAAELCFTVPDLGAMFIVALNRLRLIHLGLYHLGYECGCEDAQKLVGSVNSATFTLSGGAAAMTRPDFELLGATVWAQMNPASQEDTRQEKVHLLLNGTHREGLVIATSLPHGGLLHS